jgi:hypothetical protein
MQGAREILATEQTHEIGVANSCMAAKPTVTSDSETLNLEFVQPGAVVTLRGVYD